MSVPIDPAATGDGRRDILTGDTAIAVATPTPPLSDASSERNGTRTPSQAEPWQATLWRRLRHKPGRAVLAGLLLAAMAGVFTGEKLVQGPTKWSSDTVMIFDDPLGIALAGDAGELSKLVSVRYKYASLVATEAMAQPVAAELKIPVSAVLGSTSTIVPPNSVLLDVVGTASAPRVARTLSTAMAQQVVSYIQSEDSTYNVPASDRFTATVVSPANSATPSGPSKTRALSVALVVALAGFLVGYSVFQLVREPSRRSR
jgi:hypothetical protein